MAMAMATSIAICNKDFIVLACVSLQMVLQTIVDHARLDQLHENLATQRRLNARQYVERWFTTHWIAVVQTICISQPWPRIALLQDCKLLPGNEIFNYQNTLST